MDNQINNNRFKQDEDKVKAKIESIEKELNEDLSYIPEYKLLNVYNKINKIINTDEKKFSILKTKFLFKDKTLTGYLNLKDFHDILNNNLILEKDELKILLCDPILRNKINPNLYQYKPFLDKISNFDENEIFKMKKQYNLEQNKYLTELRNAIRLNDINLKNVWEKIYKDTKCTKNNFYLLFNEIKSNYTFHYLEIEYIFDLICEKGDKKESNENFIKYETFEKIMRMRLEQDLRVLYFKKMEKEKEKEEKKEEEKLLINYYPDLLNNLNNNNNDNIDSNEKKEEKTNYITISTIFHENENKSNDNDNEKFILGNINPGDSEDNISNDQIQQQNKGVNSIVQKVEMPKKFIVHESINNLLNFKSQLIETKGIKLKKYSNNIYNIKDNMLEKTCVVKNKTYFDEIKSKTEFDIDDIIKKRINKSNEKVNYILSQHEEYIIIKLYCLINKQLEFMSFDLLMKFKKKDTQNKKLLSFDDFISIFQTDLKMKFNNNDLKLLLNSLNNKENKENNLYSYDEFIKNLNNNNNESKIRKIEYLAIINYNNYLIDFKEYIINNKIDINSIFKAVSKNKQYLTLKEFISFCDCFNYKLSNISEYKYIFNILSKESNKNILSKSDLNGFINSSFIPEQKFIEDGKCQKNFGKNINKNWHKFIPKYDLSNEYYNLKYMNYFKGLFRDINTQKNKFGIYNFPDFFSLICDVDNNGNIYKIDFIKALSLIDIINQPIINDLLIYLEDINNKNKFQLSNFLGIFLVYYPQEIPRIKSPFNFTTYPGDPNILFKNNYGIFLSKDISKIKETCINIYEIICYIKRKTIYNYFIKFDFYKKKYFTLEQLKLILMDDLGINKKEMIDLFLCYILDHDKIDSFYVIQIDKLIDVITKFVGIKNEEEEDNLKKTTMGYDEEINNKLLGSTIMNIRLNKRQEGRYIYSPSSGIF